MNLIDAVKSGRPFRRKGEPYWRGPFVAGEGYTEVRMELSDLTADNYEIQEPEVRITRAQLIEETRRLFTDWNGAAWIYDSYGPELAKRLGLGDV